MTAGTSGVEAKGIDAKGIDERDQGPAPTRVTIVDVARRAGVLSASASKVLRNAYRATESMRARVQEVMNEVGYRPHSPAQDMGGARSPSVSASPSLKTPSLAS
jgi:DNA-binding LacI/PurR family transcriptional regulator